MFTVLSDEKLNETTVRMYIRAPEICRKARPGQFVILRVSENGERIPLTIADIDTERGGVGVIFAVVGGTTGQLSLKKAGDTISDISGPLGEPTKLDGIKRALVVSGGVGSAIALPVARALKENGASVDCIAGFRNKGLVILGDEFSSVCDDFILTTDDGSAGTKGNVTMPLCEMLDMGKKYDMIFAIGPLVMMRAVSAAAKPYGVPLTVSMNPIMIDGTGMCGCCRLTLVRDGKRTVSFACVDGPDYNGYEVDFDEAIARSRMYSDFEKAAREKNCNLFSKV